jgi:hypothetical protein
MILTGHIYGLPARFKRRMQGLLHGENSAEGVEENGEMLL